jgi:soluble epoxide hydrolase / lipid-phosphate phosphatase
MNNEIAHRYYDVNGIRMHTAELGDGPAVILCHGFPELWYSWRHQIPAIAAAGFRVIAPDLRGFGETTVTPSIDDYTPQNQCADLLALMDTLGLQQAVIIGHDWGSALAWNMGLHHSDRVRAVAGLNATGLRSLQTSHNLLKRIEAKPGIWDYHFYFQAPGVAEAEFEANVERFHILIRRGTSAADGYDILNDFHNVRARGGLLVGYPAQPHRSVIMTDEDLRYYVAAFERTGFRGALNYYRVYDALAAWAAEVKGTKLEVPVFLLTCGKDPVMSPGLTEGMEESAPRLTRHHIEDCSHWSMEEHPDEVSRALVAWLDALPADYREGDESAASNRIAAAQ